MAHPNTVPDWWQDTEEVPANRPEALAGLAAVEAVRCSTPHHEYDFDATEISCRDTADGHHSSIRRIQVSGRSEFLAEHTHSPEALAAPGTPHIICLPGITQDLQHETEQEIHDGLSQRYPSSIITTLGSNAIGIENAHDPASLQEAAEDRFHFLQETTPEGQPIILVGTSMGATIANAIANRNIQRGEPLNIQGITYLAPALVTPDRKNVLADLQFLLNLTVSSFGELGRHKPIEQVNTLRKFGGLVLGTIRQLRPVLHHSRELQLGTPLEEIEAVAERYPMRVVLARKDKFAEIAMWNNLVQQYESLHVTELHDSGHEVVFFPKIATSALDVAIGSIYDLRTYS